MRTITWISLLCVAWALGGCKKAQPAAGSASDLQERNKEAAEAKEAKAPAIALAAPVASEKELPAAMKAEGIRGIDVQKFLSEHYKDVKPDIGELETDCTDGQKPIQSVAPVKYGDLDGDGREEAAFLAWTCLSGNGGADLFGVLKMQPDGKIVALPIEGERKEFKGRQNLYAGLRGHMNLMIEDGRLVQTFPVYADEKDCENCAEGGERKFAYRWNGQQFVLDDIIEIPPPKSGS